MKKLKLAVIGKDVSKSQSPQMHSFIAKNLGYEIDYQKISIAEDEFENKIESVLNSFDGLNVTIPYKLSIIPHLKKTEGDAKVFGAVNTVKTAHMSGYNTDGLGFELMLKNGNVDVNGKKVLVLGAGGAGRSVAKKLFDNGATVFISDTNFKNAEAVAKEFKGVTALKSIPAESYFAIVNATGVGMHKTEGLSPVNEDIISACQVAIDLIYTPPQSKFLQIARSLGKKTLNGLPMLFYQAYYAECIFADLTPEGQTAQRLFNEYLKENI